MYASLIKIFNFCGTNIYSLRQGSTLTFFLGGPDRATKIINYKFLVARTGNLVARKKSLK